MIVRHPAQTKVIAMGRRWGKSTMAGALAAACAARGGAVAWVVPTYKNARAPWRAIERIVSHEPRVTINRTERTAQFKNAGWLAVYSADNDVALRGEAFDVVIVDEAAMVREETYTDVLLPTLADREGRILLISTPKGRNWFWREWVRGQQDGRTVASFQAPTSANPMPTIRRAAELARERVSDRTYRQEWLAEFVEDGGGVFRGMRPLATARPAPREDGHQYIVGVDWGRTTDATVITVMDATTRRQVALDRFTGIPYAQQIGRLRATWERYGRPPIIAEANSMGGPLIEQLQRDGLNVQPFTTTNATKAEAVDALALAFEQREIEILDDPAQLAELEAFEATRTPAGLVRYAAPDGIHDDTVMALALAWQGCRRPTGGLFR